MQWKPLDRLALVLLMVYILGQQDDNLKKGDYFTATNALADFAGSLGMSLKLNRFKDFDGFMRSKEKLVL